jgi:Apea-like HEPN
MLAPYIPLRLGEASQEVSTQSAFLKAAIALELLLVNKDSNYISPSITAKLSETVAMLLGATPEKRAELEKLTKKLYSTRSAVAHSGNSSVGWEELSHLLNIGPAAVHTLLGDEDLSKLQSIDEVLALLSRRKYSFVGFKETEDEKA